MANRPVLPLIRYLHGLTATAASEPVSDRQLLERYARHGDESAFATVVRRHGPLVLGTCWRVLRHNQDAEDAMQATFIVLARKAGSVPWRDSVAGWLHEVAVRIASEARGRRARKQTREQTTANVPEAPTSPEEAWPELAGILDEELRNLPEKYRGPLLLCYLEGRTRDEAAEMLGWTLGAVKGRLERGRDMLRRRLALRGLTLSAVLFPLALAATPAKAALTGKLLETTLQLSAGHLPQPPAGGSAVALARVVLEGMSAARVKMVAASLIAATLVAAGAVGVAAQWAPVPPPADTPSTPPPLVAEYRPARQPKPAETKLGENPVEIRHANVVRSVAFSTDGKSLLSAGWDKTVLLSDAATGKTVLKGTGEGELSAVAFTPDGKHLVTGGPDGVVRTWDAAGKEVRSWPALQGHIYSLALSPDGKTASVVGQTGDLAQIDLTKDGKPSRTAVHMGRVWSVAYSPDGSRLLTAGDDFLIRLWDPKGTGAGVRLDGHSAQVSSAQFSRDGRWIISGDWQGELGLWEVDTGTLAQRFPTQDLVQWAEFSPDSRHVVSAHRSGKVRVWDLVARESVAEFQAHTGAAYCATFAPDGKSIATSGQDGGVKIWSGAIPRASREPAAIGPGDVDQVWAELGDKDAINGHRAVRRLLAHPAEAVKLLAERLKPVVVADNKEPGERQQRVQKLLADLDSDVFKVRESATEELQAMGPEVIPAVRKAVEQTTSPEVRRRGGSVLEALLKRTASLDTVRDQRGLHVLESLGTADARKVVEALSKGTADAPLTVEANATLGRWRR